MNKKHTHQKGAVEKELRSRRILRFLPVPFLSVLAILTFISYFRALHAPLVLDDSIYIEPQRMENFFRHPSLRVRSVAEFSFALNYYISGINLFFFRVTNVLFHISTGILACYLTYITLNLPGVREKYWKSDDNSAPLYLSFAVAVLFLLHPIQTSAVNYITQRMAVMAAMFSFAGLIFYIKGALATGRKSWMYNGLSAISFVLGIFSKENAIMVLLMLPLYDFMFLSSFQWSVFRKRFAWLVALIMVPVLIAVFNLPSVGFIKKIYALLLKSGQPMGSFGWTGVDVQWTPVEYFLTELRVVSRYILLIFFPLPSLMVFDHANAYPVSKSMFYPATTIFSFLFLISLFIGALRYIKKFPLVSFGILWYLMTISLESFIALGLDPYFEHRNYLPDFGLFLALASLLAHVAKKENNGGKSFPAKIFHNFGRRRIVIISLVALLLSVLTFSRNGVWEKEYLLWKDAADKSPNNPRAFIELSSIFIKEGRFRDAGDYLQKASGLQPMTPSFRTAMLINQASVYDNTGRRQEAIAVLKGLLSEKTLSVRDLGNIFFHIGEIFRGEGKLPEAKRYLETALEKTPSHPGALTSLGLVNQSLHETDAAESNFRRSIDLDTGQVVPYIGLGDIYFMKGDKEKAEKYYNAALAGTSAIPKDMTKRVFLNLAQIKSAKNEIDDSIRLFKKIIEMDPAFYPPYLFLGDIYFKKGDYRAALSLFEKALSLKETFLKDDPNVKLIYYNIGMLYAMYGDKHLSERNLEIFLSVAGDDRRLEEQTGKAKEKLAHMRK
jgi:protein O-mannosyl-transferase